MIGFSSMFIIRYSPVLVANHSDPATRTDVDVYSNDPDIPDVQVHLISETGREVFSGWTEIRHISFDWKVLMERFFGEEALVRQHRPLGNIQLDQHISVFLARSWDAYAMEPGETTTRSQSRIEGVYHSSDPD
jgi:hypothetical protein